MMISSKIEMLFKLSTTFMLYETAMDKRQIFVKWQAIHTAVTRLAIWQNSHVWSKLHTGFETRIFVCHLAWKLAFALITVLPSRIQGLDLHFTKLSRYLWQIPWIFQKNKIFWLFLKQCAVPAGRKGRSDYLPSRW